ncbi:MAG: energy transducer TonB, partial [Chitinophagaceae bacterium]
MEPSNILSADVLDIIFDARNKDYGAYDLRKNYQRRLMKAVLSMFFIVILLLIAYFLVAAIKPKATAMVVVNDITLDKIADKQKIDLPPVIPPPVKQIVEIKTKMFTQFLITPDDKVPDNEKPPEQTELVDAKIGT